MFKLVVQVWEHAWFFRNHTLPKQQETIVTLWFLYIILSELLFWKLLSQQTSHSRFKPETSHWSQLQIYSGQSNELEVNGFRPEQAVNQTQGGPSVEWQMSQVQWSALNSHRLNSTPWRNWSEAPKAFSVSMIRKLHMSTGSAGRRFRKSRDNCKINKKHLFNCWSEKYSGLSLIQFILINSFKLCHFFLKILHCGERKHKRQAFCSNCVEIKSPCWNYGGTTVEDKCWLLQNGAW